MNTSLSYWLAKSAPFVVRSKRLVLALYDSFSKEKSSYSQHCEDQYILASLIEHNVYLKNGVYVDVGANQPTQISNTYLFYRKGLSGIAIEPSSAMEPLFRLFRPRDIFLKVGCSDKAKIAQFKHSSASVLSSFANNVSEVLKVEYIPVVPLDLALEDISYKFIYLLSIDVEGLDLNVLKGAEKTLENTIYVIVEENTDLDNIFSFLTQRGFILEKRLKCNGIYINPKNLERFKMISQ